MHGGHVRNSLPFCPYDQQLVMLLSLYLHPVILLLVAELSSVVASG